MTYENALRKGRELLKQSGVTEYDTDGFLLMSELIGLTRTQYFMKQKEDISEADYDKYMQGIAKRCEREPLQYITGHAYFMGYEFNVNVNVLIPRMDTEILVVEALKRIKTGKVLDMCTGSGCIAISMALSNDSLMVDAVDISEGALGIAKDNAAKLGCGNVSFIQSNVFENVNNTYDMIVSNPPYIRTKDIEGLMEEVKDHEPMGALDGYEDGLFFYRKITKESLKYMNDNGILCYEIGFDQAEDVINIMQDNGYKNCQVIKDLAGLNRVVIGNL